MYYYNLAESGQRLKALRMEKGRTYTQERVAEEVGISRVYLSMLEAGKKGCSVDMLLVFAQYYDVTMDYLTYGKQQGDVMNFAGKMAKLLPERRQLAEKLIYSVVEALM